jgi:hypothetical protein
MTLEELLCTTKVTPTQTTNEQIQVSFCFIVSCFYDFLAS